MQEVGRGNAAADKITCSELLDDLLEHAKANIKASTTKIWNWCVEANIRPFFRAHQSFTAPDGNVKGIPAQEGESPARFFVTVVQFRALLFAITSCFL
ncbi:MAG TPA: hypothetical protein VM120_27575 [Bryobacteraceae bacterium]|nr:hypothetical protein [Bryobacteraceae bacterium]